MMRTKIYGVSMEDVEKLRQFQFLLMKKKFGIKTFNKIAFLAYVQLKSETILNPVITRIAVINSNIQLDDGSTIISKNRILKITRNDKNVIIRLNRPLLGFGTFISFDFTNGDQIQDFLNAVGEIEYVER